MRIVGSSVMAAILCWRRDGQAEDSAGSSQTENDPDAVGGGIAFCLLLVAVERLPFGERRGLICRPDATQFNRVPRLSLAGHVVRVLQPVRLLLAQHQLPRRRQNVLPRLPAQSVVQKRKHSTAEFGHQHRSGTSRLICHHRFKRATFGA